MRCAVEQDLLAEVRQITDEPTTTICDAHTHNDHSGGDVEVPDTVDCVVHENTLAHMSRASGESVTNTCPSATTGPLLTLTLP